VRESAHGSAEARVVTVREAATADAPALARARWEFRAALAAPAEEEAAFLARCRKWMAERLGTPGAWRCWIAETDGALAGTIWVHFFDKVPNPTAEAERHAYVTNFFVRPESRGAGIGNVLLCAALEACDAAEVDAVILWATPRSRSLYERHGFESGGDLLERRR
jgi:GNAT superfamily N-acetyltransferase